MRPVVPPHLHGDHTRQVRDLVMVLPNGCWEFTGYIHPTSGYGQVGRNLIAHRVAWEAAHGKAVPKGLVVDHTCHNSDPDCVVGRGVCLHRRCVNPEHLEAVAQAVNLRRGKGWNRTNAEKTQCVHGHAYTPENTYTYKGKRQCRTCRLARLDALRPYYAEQRRLKRQAAA